MFNYEIATNRNGNAVTRTQDQVTDPLYRLDSRQLRHFLAAVKCHGFTAAAEMLHITQPALSRSIQSLEERLGVKLIERTSKTFQLTRSGQLLADKGRLIEQEFDQTLSEIEALKKGYAGTVSLGVGYASVAYLPAVIREFQTLRPNMSVRIITDSMEANYEALLEGRLDLICTALNFPQHSNLVIEKIVETRNIILARNDHPLIGRKTAKPARLLEYPWIFFTDDRMGYRQVGGYFAANQLEPPSATVETNTIEGLCGLLKQGNYLASAPSIVMDYVQETASPLSKVPIEGSFWSTELGIAYPRHVQPSLGVISLISTLKKHLKLLKDS